MATTNMATLLSKERGDELDVLRKTFVTQLHLFSTAQDLGRGKSATIKAVAVKALNADQRAALKALLISTVDAARKRLDADIQYILRRKKKSASLRLVGSVLALFAGGSGILFSAPGVTPETAKFLVSAVSLVAGVIGLVAGHLETAPSGVRVGSAKDYDALIQIRVEIECMRQRLALDTVIQLSDHELLEMEASAESSAGEVLRLSYKHS